MAPLADQPAVLDKVRHSILAAVAAALVVAVLVPCITPTTPVVYFDGDPRLAAGDLASDTNIVTALGPTGMATLQTVTVVLAVLATAAAVWAGANLAWWVIALATAGAFAAAGHMVDGNARWEDWTKGGAWITAAAVGVAGYHIAQHAVARRWVVALLCAATVPLALEAMWDVWVQHDLDVQFFEEHKKEILAIRGIEVGSEQAALFERRARSTETSGVFTTSNLLASVAGALGLCGASVFAVGRRRGRGAWVGLVCAAAGLLTVWLTGSLGATVAVVMAGSVLVWLVVTQRRDVPRWITPTLAVGLVAIAFSAVLVRGAAGPPEMPADGFVPGRAVEGERSLLFRAHYWSAASKMAASHPLRGVGARGFADLYPALKDPLNPETVTSAHNVWVDQIAMLGIGGAAWSGLLLIWLGLAAWRSRATTVSAAEDGGDDNEAGPVARSEVWLAVAAAALLFGICLAVRQATLYLDTALLWLLALAGFVAVAACLGSRSAMADHSRRIALLVAATVVLIHNQIEMTFFQPESMGVMWLIVGCAAAPVFSRSVQAKRSAKKIQLPRGVAHGIGGLIGVGLIVSMGFYGAGVVRHENAMRGASTALLRGDVPLAVERLAIAQDAAGWDTQALRWRVQLYSIEPLGMLLQAGQRKRARQRIDESLVWMDDATRTHGSVLAAARLRAQTLERWAHAMNDRPEDILAAAKAYEQVRRLSPYNVQDAWAVADLAKRRGDREAATDYFREALVLREQMYLDSADPLTVSQLEAALAYLAEANEE